MVELQLSRLDSSPWGFRLQGGTDFGTPLLIQKVRPVNLKVPSQEFFLFHKSHFYPHINL